MRHAVEIAQEVRAPDFGGLDTLVAEFAEKTAVAAVDGMGDTAEVGKKVVGDTSVDMVDGHTGRNVLVAPGDIDGMGSKDKFMSTEGIPELQISLFASPFTSWSWFCNIRIHQHFSTVEIDTHTDYTALAVIDIEGDVILGVRADIGDPHVVKEEG